MSFENVPLAEVCEINPKRLESIANDATVSFLGMADVSEAGTTAPGADRPFGDVRKGYTAFQDNDILLAKITPCFQNGKIAQARLARLQGAGSTEFHVLRGLDGRLDQRYMLHFLRRDQVLIDGERRMTGSGGQRRVPVQFLETLQIPLPPLPEQRRIAAILDHADALRAKRREAIARRDELSQSIFVDMFGEHDSNWPRVTIADIAAPAKGSIRTGPFGSQLLHDEFTDSGIPVLGIDNAVNNRFEWAKPRFITPDKYETLKRYTVYPGDVLITIMGTNGRCAIVPDVIPTAINTKHLCCITPNSDLVTSEFLHSYFLLHPDARRYLRQTAKGAIMAGLNMGIIKAMPVHLPPIDLQRKFGTIWTKSASQALFADVSADTLDSLFSSLQSRAFRGEL